MGVCALLSSPAYATPFHWEQTPLTCRFFSRSDIGFPLVQRIRTSGQGTARVCITVFASGLALAFTSVSAWVKSLGADRSPRRPAQRPAHSAAIGKRARSFLVVAEASKKTAIGTGSVTGCFASPGTRALYEFLLLYLVRKRPSVFAVRVAEWLIAFGAFDREVERRWRALRHLGICTKFRS